MSLVYSCAFAIEADIKTELYAVCIAAGAAFARLNNDHLNYAVIALSILTCVCIVRDCAATRFLGILLLSQAAAALLVDRTSLSLCSFFIVLKYLQSKL